MMNYKTDTNKISSNIEKESFATAVFWDSSKSELFGNLFNCDHMFHHVAWETDYKRNF